MTHLDEAHKLLKPPLSEEESNNGVSIVKMLEGNSYKISMMPGGNKLIDRLDAAKEKIYLNNFSKIFQALKEGRVVGQMCGQA